MKGSGSYVEALGQHLVNVLYGKIAGQLMAEGRSFTDVFSPFAVGTVLVHTFVLSCFVVSGFVLWSVLCAGRLCR